MSNLVDMREAIEESIHKHLQASPFTLVPLEIAFVPTEHGMFLDNTSMHQIKLLNVRMFDHLTDAGYRLNMIEGRFVK